MSPPSSVSAVVVTWNSRHDIERCLSSLERQTHPLERVVVVDNASSDGTPDEVRTRFPQMLLLSQRRNVGFAAANNLGIQKARTDWVLTLNPDAWLEADYIETLLNYAENKGRLGMVGGKICRPDASDSVRVIDSAGIEIFTSRRVRDRGIGQRDVGQYAKPERVFGICAAAALYRREMLVDTVIGGEVFPERFFAYYEDADLAWRAWRRGWEAWFVPAAVGWHRRGGSPVGSKFSRRLTHRNRLWLVARNESLSRAWIAFPSFYKHELLMLMRTLRYPYLLAADIQALLGLGWAKNARRRLKEVNPNPPPFVKGVGFGKDEM